MGSTRSFIASAGANHGLREANHGLPEAIHRLRGANHGLHEANHGLREAINVRELSVPGARLFPDSVSAPEVGTSACPDTPSVNAPFHIQNGRGG
jgi:hypothetical protein